MSPVRWPQYLRVVPEDDSAVQRVAQVLIGVGEFNPLSIGSIWYNGNLELDFVVSVRLVEDNAAFLRERASEIEPENPILAQQIRETVQFAIWALAKPIGQIVGTEFAAA